MIWPSALWHMLFGKPVRLVVNLKRTDCTAKLQLVKARRFDCTPQHPAGVVDVSFLWLWGKPPPHGGPTIIARICDSGEQTLILGRSSPSFLMGHALAILPCAFGLGIYRYGIGGADEVAGLIGMALLLGAIAAWHLWDRKNADQMVAWLCCELGAANLV